MPNGNTPGPGRGRRAHDMRSGEKLIHTNISVTENLRNVLKKLGRGNLSLGVRMAARYVKAQKYLG